MTWPGPPITGDQREDIKEYLLTLRGQYGEYERHKENMAWATIVFYIGFLFTIISNYNPDLELWHYILGLFVVAFVFAIYIQLQLDMRRDGSIIGNACASLYGKMLRKKDRYRDIDLELIESKEISRFPKLDRFPIFDYINKRRIIEQKVFPAFLIKEIDDWSPKSYPTLTKLENGPLLLFLLITLISLFYLIFLDSNTENTEMLKVLINNTKNDSAIFVRLM